jgi:glycosyltransferase involved in cell wall biosynthesis
MNQPAQPAHRPAGAILWDATGSRRNRHLSGLNRVSRALAAALDATLTACPGGSPLHPVVWQRWRRRFVPGAPPPGSRAVAPPRAWITSDYYQPSERPGIAGWLHRFPGARIAIFHDAIPWTHPSFAWPKSRRRFPQYLEHLAGMDRILAVSRYAAETLQSAWDDAGIRSTPPVDAITLGADGSGHPRETGLRTRPDQPSILMIGILEPRKRQTLLLEAARMLWERGLPVRLDFVGRVNPHFGPPVQQAIEAAARAGDPVRWHGPADDATVRRLLNDCSLVVVPSAAEGCGLPVLEGLWAGCPVVASDLPSIRESARGGGVHLVAEASPEAWAGALDRLLGSDRAAAWQELARQAVNRALPAWRDTARQVLARLEETEPRLDQA